MARIKQRKKKLLVSVKHGIAHSRESCAFLLKIIPLKKKVKIKWDYAGHEEEVSLNHLFLTGADSGACSSRYDSVHK